LIHTRIRRTVDVVEEIVDAVVSSPLDELGCCVLADVNGFFAFAGGRVQAEGGEDGFEGFVDGGVVPGAVEDPGEGVVGRVGDGELLEGEGFAFGVYGCEVLGALNDGGCPG
jgi:hypothetical protein